MTAKQTKRAHKEGATSTVIETGWLCARYAHRKVLPAWLHQTLAHVRQQAGAGRLPVVILPTTGQQESLVVLTLREFLTWSHQRMARNDRGGN